MTALAGLPPQLETYLEALIEHAQTALWPERRAALASFRRGIKRSDPEDLRLMARHLGFELAEDSDPADAVFQTVLTAYIERLGAAAVTNPDQAKIYAASLDTRHIDLAKDWLDSHPEHRDVE